MKTFWRVLSYMLVAVIAAGTTAVCFVVEDLTSGDKLEQVKACIDRYFIGEVDMDKVEDVAAGAMVEALGDEWSYYMTAEQYLSYQDTMDNSYVGVGITVAVREDGQGIDVLSVTTGSPAQAAGILAGDIIVAVDGQSVVGADMSVLTGLVRGKEGTFVEMGLLRDGEETVIRVERKRFHIPVVGYEMLEGDVGLVSIANFDSKCADETIAAVEALRSQGAKALIFDVRDNPGGYRRELIRVLDYLLPEGPLFRTEDYLGNVTVDRSDASFVDLPMAVLMDLESYSAAEFFAAALDEYDAAITVGERTYGKGYMQVAFPLTDGSAVNLSMGKYFTPNGVSLVGVGLTPDVEVPVDEETAAKIRAGILDPAEDPQIQAALEALGAGK